MIFQDIIQEIKNVDGITVNVPENWGQGRATFGGLVAGIMYERLAKEVDSDRKVRSIQMSFVAPVSPGELDVMVKVLRAGKGATQVQATAYQNDQVCAVLLASFGGDRESAISVQSETAPETKTPDDGTVMPFIKNLTPDFTQFFDYSFTKGKMPFMGSTEPLLGGWIRLKESTQQTPVTVPEILALLDAWPPATFTMLKKPASGSSLSWTINFVDVPQDVTANDWWQYEAHIKHSAHGYGHVDASLWDKNGKISVLSRQTISVFG